MAGRSRFRLDLKCEVQLEDRISEIENRASSTGIEKKVYMIYVKFQCERKELQSHYC